MKSSSAQDPTPNDDFLNGKNEVGPTLSHVKKESFKAHGYLFPIDEAEEFYDPFSDLSLFLSRKIKEKLVHEQNPKKWSRAIQTLLFKEILPDFRKAFPKYRLGHTALKKTWDKVLYYMEVLQTQKGTLNADGKLNTELLIRQNLKNLLQTSTVSDHPYNTAHKLGVKISECIAAIDSERPNLEDLTKTIWAMQKHLIVKTSSQAPCPFERYDQLDKLIVRFQLEEIAKAPYLNRSELMQNVKRKVEHLKELERIKTIEDLSSFLYCSLAEKLYAKLALNDLLSEQELIAINSFIRKEIAEHKKSGRLVEEKDRVHFVHKLVFLYKLSSQLSAEEVSRNLEVAVDYVYKLSTNQFSTQTPVLHPEVYSFIDTEIYMLKDQKVQDPLERVLSTLISCFNEAQKLPKIPPELYGELEIVVWKAMQEELSILDRLPQYMKETIIEELANVHIDHPKEPFVKIVSITLHYLKKVREIDTKHLDEKVKIWSLQNDMIAKWLHFDNDCSILKFIQRLWKAQKTLSSHAEFVEKVLTSYLKANPSLSDWRYILRQRVMILYKYFWYNHLSTAQETSYERFLKWHLQILSQSSQEEFSEVLITNLEQISESLLPLAPFTHKHCRDLITSAKEHV